MLDLSMAVIQGYYLWLTSVWLLSGIIIPWSLSILSSAIVICGCTHGFIHCYYPWL